MLRPIQEIAENLAPTRDVRRFYARINFSPVLFLIMLAVALCIQLGIIAPTFPQFPPWLNAVHFLVIIYIFLIGAIVLLTPLMVLAMSRNIPMVYAHVACLVVFGVLYRSTHYLWFGNEWAGWGDFARSNAARAVMQAGVAIPYLAAWKSEAAKSLGQVPELVPFFSRVRVESRTVPFAKLISKEMRGKILYMKAANQYVEVTNQYGRTNTLRLTLKEAIEKLPKDSGVRVHRSFWVSDDILQKSRIDWKNQEIKITGEEPIPISRAHLQEVRNLTH